MASDEGRSSAFDSGLDLLIDGWTLEHQAGRDMTSYNVHSCVERFVMNPDGEVDEFTDAVLDGALQSAFLSGE